MQTDSRIQDGKKVVYTSKEILDNHFGYIQQPPEPTLCPFCGKQLYYEGMVYNGVCIAWNLTEPQKCDCPESAKALAEKEEAERLAETKAKQDRHQRRTESLISKSGMRRKYVSCSFESFKVNQHNSYAFSCVQDYANNFDQNAMRGKGIYLQGSNGTGKTHLAAALAMHLMRKGIPTIFRTANELLLDIRQGIDEDNEDSRLRRYYSVPLLVIDDLGKEKCTEWSIATLFDIINRRYEDMMPTVITTNYNNAELVKRETTRDGDSETIKAIISRLHEMNQCITMVWDDYRKGGA